MLEKIKSFDYALSCHRAINQTYGQNLEYGFHIELCHYVANYFRNSITSEEVKTNFSSVLSAVHLHDLIEDSWQINYNTILEEFGVEVAELVYLVTDNKGRTRKERHSNLSEIATNEKATFVKLCDNIANVLYSCYSKSSMFSKYKKEFQDFKHQLFRQDLASMFDFLSDTYLVGQIPEHWKGTIKMLEIKYTLQ